MKNKFIIKLFGLIRWSLLRHKVMLPSFSALQVVLAIALVYGMSLIIPEVNEESAIYLSSGAITLGIIAVGCVLAPQIVGGTKQNGIFKFQRTLPVSRVAILVSDVIIWTIASIPGIIVGIIATVYRFDLTVNVSFLNILIIILLQVIMISIGFALAYWLSANLMILVTQLIMFGALLFSPITYPASRLPEWINSIYEFLPFVPTSNLIRTLVYDYGSFDLKNLIVVLIWGVLATILAIYALSRKD